MTYKTHISTGLLFSSIFFLLIMDVQFTPLLVPLLIIATIVGASAPDLDTPSGGLWRQIPAGSVISRIVKPAFIGGHRHLSHSFLGLVILTFLFWLLTKLVFINIPILDASNYFGLTILAFIVGYLSHLLADSFTEAGVPLLFPLEYHFGIPPDPLGKMRIKTGKWFENLIIYPIVNIALVIVIYRYIVANNLAERIIDAVKNSNY